jgi:hypothetical protein
MREVLMTRKRTENTLNMPNNIRQLSPVNVPYVEVFYPEGW